jgi:uncharacterized membrane protein
MSDTQFPRAKRKGSVARVVLVASLALNLAVVGLVVGAALRSDDTNRPGSDSYRARAMQNRDFGMGPFIGALDEEARRGVGQAFVKRAGSSDNARKDARVKLSATLEFLTADPFDADAFRENLEAHQAQFSERQNVGLMVLVDYLVELSPADRVSYAERLELALTRPASRGQDRGPDRAKGTPPPPQ